MWKQKISWETLGVTAYGGLDVDRSCGGDTLRYSQLQFEGSTELICRKSPVTLTCFPETWGS